jgi:hypothetical protein
MNHAIFSLLNGDAFEKPQALALLLISPLYGLPRIVHKRVNPPRKADLVLLSMEANQNDP